MTPVNKMAGLLATQLTEWGYLYIYDDESSEGPYIKVPLGNNCYVVISIHENLTDIDLWVTRPARRNGAFQVVHDTKELNLRNPTSIDELRGYLTNAVYLRGEN